MTESQFGNYLPYVKDLFAHLVASNGVAYDRAKTYSEKSIAAILEKGIETQGHYFFIAQKNEKTVGHLWFEKEIDKLDRPRVFIYMVDVLREYRHNGYAMDILEFAKTWAQKNQAERLELNVFGHNKGAQKLYEKFGMNVSQKTYSMDL